MEEGWDAGEVSTIPKSGDADGADAIQETEVRTKVSAFSLPWAGPQTQIFLLFPRTMEQEVTWVRRKDGYLNAAAIASVAVSLTTTGSTRESCLWSVYAKNYKTTIGEPRLCASG